MNVIKRFLSTIINTALCGVTAGILPLVLWCINKPLVGQMLFNTPQATGKTKRLVYAVMWLLLTITVIGLVIAIVWCLLGKEPLALQITNALTN